MHTTRMNLRIILLSGGGQTKKSTECMTYNKLLRTTSKLMYNDKQISGCLGTGVEGGMNSKGRRKLL